MSNQHVLKIHPAPLADLMSGAKTAEVRRNDRGFQVGDTVRLMEVNPETGNWTGATDYVRTISHIQTGYGLPDGMCVLSYTQPADGEPVAPKRCATIRVNRLDSGRYAPKVMRFDAGQFPDGELIDVYAAPPAAAHGDEAVRKDAERYRWLRNPGQDVALVLDKKTGHVPVDERGFGGYGIYEYRAGTELDEAVDAAMRAQGDGGADHA